ncbi:MAG: hypothetical protein OXI86_03030, partial [Candidatus Poribacteria bacterium]|nr:hypothetical protein [Candidatus Poribacteria bacterium]
MKKISTVLACLVLGIHLAILNQLAQAQKEIKLIADEEVTEQQMASDISGDSVIVGSHRHNFAK